jgi:hypothetical protein
VGVWSERVRVGSTVGGVGGGAGREGFGIGESVGGGGCFHNWRGLGFRSFLKPICPEKSRATQKCPSNAISESFLRLSSVHFPTWQSLLKNKKRKGENEASRRFPPNSPHFSQFSVSPISLSLPPQTERRPPTR